MADSETRIQSGVKKATWASYHSALENIVSEQAMDIWRNTDWICQVQSICSNFI